MFFNKYKEKRDGVIRGYDVKSARVKIACAAIMIICLLMVAVCIFPALWVFLASFKDIKEFTRDVSIFPKKLDIDGLLGTWKALKFTKYYQNSFLLVIGATVCAIFFNGLLAYAIAILKPKGYKIAYALIMWSLLIPATTSIVALNRNIYVIGLQGSFIPLWLFYGANAFYFVLFKQFFEELPKELLEAARLDGCGVLQVFFNIIMPLSKPIIMVVAIFAVTAAWSDFLLPYLLLNGSGKETVMVKLFTFKDTPTNATHVIRATLFAIILPTILFLIFQKQITDGATAGAVKG